MPNNEELIGTMVLIHPQLPNDPADKAGKVGIITGADLDRDNIFVSFGRAGQGVYGSDAVLVLRPAEQLKDTLEKHKADLKVDDYGTLYQMALLKEFRITVANIKTAMSLAMRNETVLGYGMQSLEDKLGLRQEHSMLR
jgi:hypothetical protein